MRDLIDPPSADDALETLTQVTNRASNSPFQLRSRGIPRHGYYRDPETGAEYSGGMEIAPTNYK